MHDLWQQITETKQEIDELNDQINDYASKVPSAEAAYYSEKTRVAYELERQGKTATFIQTVLKGTESVVELMEEYHRLEAEMKNANEARMVLKKWLDILNDQYAREWSRV